MSIRRLLNLIDLSQLDDKQQREIRKILQDRQKEIEAELKLVDRALGKKRKSKRTPKR